MTHNTPHSPTGKARCRRLIVAAMAFYCLSTLGCSWIPKGEGFHDEMSSWSKNVRKQEESDGTPLGTSNKALEIERNLGYR